GTPARRAAARSTHGCMRATRRSRRCRVDRALGCHGACWSLPEALPTFARTSPTTLRPGRSLHDRGALLVPRRAALRLARSTAAALLTRKRIPTNDSPHRRGAAPPLAQALL